jgi:hypothetical protein
MVFRNAKVNAGLFGTDRLTVRHYRTAAAGPGDTRHQLIFSQSPHGIVNVPWNMFRN